MSKKLTMPEINEMLDAVSKVNNRYREKDCEESIEDEYEESYVVRVGEFDDCESEFDGMSESDAKELVELAIKYGKCAQIFKVRYKKCRKENW